MAKTRKKSPLATVERLSPNRHAPRNSLVRGSTPHHAAGNLSVEALLGLPKVTSYNPKTGMSMNYAIGSDGRSGLAVEETNRPWTSSSPTNDNRCITTEISNSGGAPDWRMTDAAINSFLNQTVEQARFYGYKKVNYKVKPANITPDQVEAWIKTWAKDDEWIITLHNWFIATDCPGPYFTRQIPWLVKEMNKRLSNENYAPEAFVGEGNTATGQAIPVPTPDPTPAPSLKSIDVIAKEVIDGLWGNGQERVTKLTAAGYKATEVQAKVTELLKPTSTVPTFKFYEVTITVSALNIRKGPGTNYPVARVLSNDKNTYTIVEEDTSGKWGKLKSGEGWVLLEYTKKR